jgi:hypothetical protein
MPIKLMVKPKVAPAIEKTVVKSGTSQEISDLIDKIGGMQAAVDKVKARQKRDADEVLKPFADTMKLLVGLLNKVEDKEPLEEFEQHGNEFDITASKCTQVRTLVDVKGAITKLNKAVKGDSVLGFKLATITLTNLDKYLSPIEQQDIVTKTNGDRAVKEIRRRPKV